MIAEAATGSAGAGAATGTSAAAAVATTLGSTAAVPAARYQAHGQLP
jgi:hypothetical protein